MPVLYSQEFNRLGKRNVNLPLWIGILMVLAWIALSAWFFHATEGWLVVILALQTANNS